MTPPTINGATSSYIYRKSDEGISSQELHTRKREGDESINTNRNYPMGVDMELTTERLMLRPWVETDVEDLYRYAKDDRVGPIAGWPPHSSVEDSAEIIRTVFSAPETYAVCLKEDNRAIGSIGLMIGTHSDKEIPDTEAEIGYWIGIPFWGKGLIPEATRELIRHGFEDLKLDKIWCGCFVENEKSKRVMEKCGFTWHHTRKDVCCELMGDIRTEQVSCLTREYWLNQLKD